APRAAPVGGRSWAQRWRWGWAVGGSGRALWGAWGGWAWSRDGSFLGRWCGCRGWCGLGIAATPQEGRDPLLVVVQHPAVGLPPAVAPQVVGAGRPPPAGGRRAAPPA